MQTVLPLFPADAEPPARPAYGRPMTRSTRQPTVAVVSFRLGGGDGVSVEAAKWEGALRRLGFGVRRVAGEVLGSRRRTDVVVPELAIGSGATAAGGVEPAAEELEAALEGATMVVVENLLSLPLNLPAARVLAKVLAGHDRVVLRHHDLPWQRPAFAGVDELPPDLPGALHLTINDRSRHELAERGITAVTVRNHFDFDQPAGDRAATRQRLGVAEHAVLLLHPVRAIPRKDVPAAVALAEAVADRLPGRAVTYWLPGPAEDGYAAELERVLGAARVPVLRDAGIPMGDAYAACDAVLFPSLWEGFGNPTVESIVHRRPLAVAPYPVLQEIVDLGIDLLPADRPEELVAVLAGTRDLGPVLERNRRVARKHLALDLLPGRIAELFRSAGWPRP